jgi:tRNA1Val (adenine37-N6)-methyltransferase
MSFQFKKFKLEHHDSVFKFGTDAALLATHVDVEGVNKVLEIGTGSGVITLMMAQRNPEAKFTAIDISASAIALAEMNGSNYPLPSSITFGHSSLQDFKSNQNFDLIVSNPPFFENATKSPNELKNNTRHTDILPLRDLIQNSKELLSENGKIEIIYPSRYLTDIETICNELELYVTQVTFTRSTAQKPIKRVMIKISKSPSAQESNELIINGDHSGYSKEIYARFKPFYLKL